MRAELDSAIKAVSPDVDSLDFALQKRKMVEVLGWAPEAVDLMECEYRKFLKITAALRSIGSDIVIVPNRAIDEFWHSHIMDTEKYHSDCDIVLGGYLHHFPYLGFQDEADILEWKSISSESNAIWEDAFGVSLYGNEPNGDAYAIDRKWVEELSYSILASRNNSAMRCRTACKPQKCK